MSSKYINIYNNLISLTTNKILYKGLKKQDVFSDRLLIFLAHFAFFLNNFKSEENTKILQEIYDFNFRQIELSIREIGYGDQTINKKMKDYINLFHSIISEIHFWNDLNDTDKEKIISNFFENFGKIDYLVDYFEEYRRNISKKTLNFYLKSVNNL